MSVLTLRVFVKHSSVQTLHVRSAQFSPSRATTTTGPGAHKSEWTTRANVARGGLMKLVKNFLHITSTYLIITSACNVKLKLRTRTVCGTITVPSLPGRATTQSRQHFLNRRDDTHNDKCSRQSFHSLEKNISGRFLLTTRAK